FDRRDRPVHRNCDLETWSRVFWPKSGENDSCSSERMSRSRRIVIPGLAHHVFNRGHNRAAIFHDHADYLFFLALLRHGAAAYRVALHVYVLMTNHFHVIATPSDADSFGPMMKDVGGEYTTHFNGKYERSGTLWTQRYRSPVIESDKYWLTCARYIEQNPVRAAIVEAPEQYPWSSYRAHAFGEWPTWLTPHRTYLALGATDEERQQEYRAQFGALTEDDLQVFSARPRRRVFREPVACGR